MCSSKKCAVADAAASTNLLKIVTDNPPLAKGNIASQRVKWEKSSENADRALEIGQASGFAQVNLAAGLRKKAHAKAQRPGAVAPQPANADGSRRLRPVGTVESSPALQCWE
jgi:hypothetical protein